MRTLQQKIDEVLGPLIPKGSRCALLDYPNHKNVGDSAIWLGEQAWLRRNNNTVVYTCDSKTYSRNALARRLGCGTILLHGGGNLGDLYPGPEQFREQVLADFPNHPIIQLPQTIYFQDQENLSRAQRAVNAHGQVTLLIRDRRSLAVAQEVFSAPSMLCPDMAFALGPIARPSQGIIDILWLSRRDIEARHTSIKRKNIEIVDWAEAPQPPLLRFNRFLFQQYLERPRGLRSLRHLLPVMFDPAAHARLAQGCALLSRGRVVVTDRLHGHILSLLLRIPHVVLDNSYSKVKAFYETWTKDCDLVHWADTPTGAMEAAEALVNRSRCVKHD